MLTNYYLCGMENIGQYIDSLVKKTGHKQSDIARSIGVPRQLLSYIIAGQRELSMQMALKLESYFNLPEGKLLIMQVEASVNSYKQQQKDALAEQLLKANAFWSYTNVKVHDISDEEIIERVFIYLDLKDIAKLFELYQRDYVRKIWKEKLAVQGDYLFNLNVMIALYYFDIKQPEQYLRRLEREHIKQQLTYA
ncbi:MAG: helix-turn-helix domain-containing protein [Rikenellaceae bacterium]